MKKQNQQLDPQVEALLINKSYEQLSPAEIELVAKHITAEEFQAFREVLLSAKAFNAAEELSPAPAVHEELLKQFRQAQAQPSLWTKVRNILQHPIPSWQVGLACLLLCLGTYFLSGEKQSAVHKVDRVEVDGGNEGQVILTSRSAAEEKALLVLLTGVK